jgi:hypothetical protein
LNLESPVFRRKGRNAPNGGFRQDPDRLHGRQETLDLAGVLIGSSARVTQFRRPPDEAIFFGVPQLGMPWGALEPEAPNSRTRFSRVHD